jgi:hypothetical protein
VENRTAAARVVMGMATVGPLTAVLPDPGAAREMIGRMLSLSARPRRAGPGAKTGA